MPIAAKTDRQFGDISLTKAIFRKYLKENYSTELYLNLSFKYFANLYFIPFLFTKSVAGPNDIGEVDLQALMG